MAYDRPSPKFLSFLAKHYCLTQSVPQVQSVYYHIISAVLITKLSDSHFICNDIFRQ